MKILTIIFFCCCCMPVFAGELKGIVSDTETGELLRGVQVSNTSEHTVTFTDDKGAFTLTASPGDTVKVSFTGYLQRALVLQGEAPSFFRRIALSKNLVAIDTVVINASLTPYQRDSLARRSLYKKKLEEKPAKFKRNKPHPLYGGLGQGNLSFNGPLSSFFQKRSKRYKRAKAFQERFLADERQRYTDSRYNAEAVRELTGLKDAALAAFMDTYPIPYDFARTATDIEVQMWIRYNYRLWLAKAAAKQ